MSMTKEEVQAAIEEATKALVAKNKELLGELKVARKNSEIKPEDMEKLEGKIEELSAKLNVAEKNSKLIIAERDTFKAQLEKESDFTKKLLIDNGLTENLVKAGVSKEFLPAVKAMLAQRAAIVADGDAKKAVIGDKELSASILEWSQSDEGKPFVLAPKNSGGGATGSGTGTTGDQRSATRKEFDAMDIQAKMTFSKGGGKLSD